MQFISMLHHFNQSDKLSVPDHFNEVQSKQLKTCLTALLLLGILVFRWKIRLMETGNEMCIHSVFVEFEKKKKINVYRIKLVN